jgi:hypothetical protein
MWRDPEIYRCCGAASTKGSGADDFASALHQDYIAPAAIHAAQFFANANDAETTSLMGLDAGNVFGKDSRLQGPDAMLLGSGDQSGKQFGAYFLAAGPLGDVDADFSDTRVNAAAGNRAERGPSDSFLSRARYQPADLQMRCVPFSPFREGRFKCGIARGDPLDKNLADRKPVIDGHRFDGQ